MTSLFGGQKFSRLSMQETRRHPARVLVGLDHIMINTDTVVYNISMMCKLAHRVHSVPVRTRVAPKTSLYFHIARKTGRLDVELDGQYKLIINFNNKLKLTAIIFFK